MIVFNPTEKTWAEIYISRQNRLIINWPVIGVEKHECDSNGFKKEMYCLVISRNGVKGIVPIYETDIKEALYPELTQLKLINFIGETMPVIVIEIQKDYFIASKLEALKKI